MELDTGGNVDKNSRGIPNSSSLKWVAMKRSWSGLRYYPSICLEGMNKQNPFSAVRILTESPKYMRNSASTSTARHVP